MTFPYYFITRKGGTGEPVWHDRLHSGRYDVAFEVEWRLRTATACNPVMLPELAAVPFNFEGYPNSGYRRGWLTTPDGHPVISPFTVKGAIANAFANLLGGCYRVLDQDKEHDPGIKSGTFAYGGRWKRYRTAKKSPYTHTGVIKSITVNSDGSREIILTPVKEYFFIGAIPAFCTVNGQYDVIATDDPDRKSLISKILKPGAKIPGGLSNDFVSNVTYGGPYRFGMRQDLATGDLGKPYTGRFYKTLTGSVSGCLRAEHFEPKDDLKRKVHLGQFRPLDPTDTRPKNGPHSDGVWWDDLSTLGPGDFVYYQRANGGAHSLGRNYLFRALFLHEDAVPAANRRCTSVAALCPRCSMFGITEEGAGDDREAIGLRGRFKASALVCRDKRLATMRSAPAAYPFDPTFQPLLHEWFDDDNTFIAKQVLLPVLGQPKASKRDVDGYYDPASGMIKGAKVYRHGLRGPVANINDVDSRTDKESRASHKLRPFVQICKPGLVFFGTLGAENCDAKELAALLLLLDYGMINHGFKLGLGRSFGLGSVTSSVIRIWIRSASAPQWKTLTFLSGCTADDRLAMLDMPEVTECKETLWKQYHAYQQYNKKSLDEHAQRLAFPDKWLQYWNNAWR